MEMSTYTKVALLILGTAQVYSTVQQGKARKSEAKRQEKLAEIDARSREIARMKRLQAFAATTAAQGAAGNIDPTSGSFANQQIVAARESRLGGATEQTLKEIKVKGYRDIQKYARRGTIAGVTEAAAGTYLAGAELGEWDA